VVEMERERGIGAEPMKHSFARVKIACEPNSKDRRERERRASLTHIWICESKIPHQSSLCSVTLNDAI